jgi:threonine dehydratase
MHDSHINKDRIAATYSLIRPHIRRTPVIEVDGRDFGLDCGPLLLKLELFQHTGSFKPRGALANLLMREVPAAGVAAASGGNHGAAVAFAAMKLGKPARIFVPTVASSSKIDRIRSYGAELVVQGERYADALAASEEWVAQSGALPVHAYDQVETLLGQGSVGLEFEQQALALDTLLVAVGGGGLIGGVAAWYSGATRVIGVEPEAAPTLANALQAGGRSRGRNRGRFACAETRRRADVSHRAKERPQRRACFGRRYPPSAGLFVEHAANCRRARRCGGIRRASLAALSAAGR